MFNPLNMCDVQENLACESYKAYLWLQFESF